MSDRHRLYLLALVVSRFLFAIAIFVWRSPYRHCHAFPSIFFIAIAKAALTRRQALYEPSEMNAAFRANRLRRACGKSRVPLAWHSSACYAGYGQSTYYRISAFYLAFSLKWSQLSYRGLSLSQYIYPFYVYTFSFSVYVLFVCILFVHFFLVYVSSVYFLLYKHTGGGGGGVNNQ